ncbi:hypothetical protein Lser_V15G11701 [Lactuca serriola]
MMTAFQIMFLIILAMAVIPSTIKAMNPRKLDETTNPVGTPDDQIKCGSCPCGTTCYTSPPPPSPSPPPPSPPPPPKKKPPPSSGANCPPPPYSGGGGGGGGGLAPPNYIYITGPPGDLYPVVQSISGGDRSFTVVLPLLVLSGLVGMVALL